jgi:cell division septum initiation protein DivIVA
MSNQPRHGDEIIVPKKSALGGDKLIASRQFQEFLDDLATESAEFTDVSDIVQIASTLSDKNQELQAELTRTNKVLASNSQQIAIMQSAIDNLTSAFNSMGKQLNNVEQTANVN